MPPPVRAGSGRGKRALEAHVDLNRPGKIVRRSGHGGLRAGLDHDDGIGGGCRALCWLCILLGEDLACDAHGRYRVGPARVKGQLRDRLDQFGLRHAVLTRKPHMRPELFGTVERNQCRDGDQAAVALREAGALPYVAKENIVGEVRELGCDVAHELLGTRLIDFHRRGLLLEGVCGRGCDAEKQHRDGRISDDRDAAVPKRVRAKKGMSLPIAASRYSGTQ